MFWILHKYYPNENVKPNKATMTYQGDAFFLADISVFSEEVLGDAWSVIVDADSSGVSSLAICSFDIWMLYRVYKVYIQGNKKESEV